MDSKEETPLNDVDKTSDTSSLLSPFLLKKMQQVSSTYLSSSTSTASSQSSFRQNETHRNSSDSPASFSSLYLLHMDDNKQYFEESKKKNVTFKAEPVIIPSRTFDQNNFIHESKSKVLCPHTGCPCFVPVKTGRLTAHFKHCHKIITSRAISRGQDEHFTLKMDVDLHNNSCFNILQVSSKDSLPASTLFLMVTRFRKMINYKTCYRILIWILADEITTPVNVILSFEGETIQCRAKTLEDPPDTSNGLYLSKKALKKFHYSNGGEFTLRVL